jgi:protein kinase-like protein
MHTKDDFKEQSPSEAVELDDAPASGELSRQRGDARSPDARPAGRGCSELPEAPLLFPRASFFPTPDCLTDDEVLAFSEGRVSEARRARIELHMDGCSTCQQLVQWAAWDIDATFTDSGTLGWVTTFSKGRVVAGRYRIVRFVARGGMGEVYEAFDRKLNERVALKTMLCAASDSQSALGRLCHEVQLARRIAHPNVCRTHELHEHKERKRARAPIHFVAMEFVNGEPLTERLLRGPIPLTDALSIARQLLSGLEAAHDAGVLHLDFKSSNVMLRHGSGPPQAVIMDFSLSRALDTAAHLRTSERRLAGSAGYMSPEQLECRPKLGPESDLYSFGVVLFELLAGRSPFQGDSLPAIITQQLQEPPAAPSSVVSSLSPALDAFVLKCLSREPADRYPSVAAARAAFDQVVRDEPARDAGARPFWLVLLAAAVIGLVVSTVYLARNEPSTNVAEPTPAAEPSIHTASLTPAPAPPEPSSAVVADRLAAPEPAPLAHKAESKPRATKARAPAKAPRPRVIPAKAAPPEELEPPPAASNEAPRGAVEPPAARGDEGWQPQKAPRNLL